MPNAVTDFPAYSGQDYRPAVEAGTTWVTGSPVMAVLTLYPREDHLYVENTRGLVTSKSIA